MVSTLAVPNSSKIPRVTRHTSPVVRAEATALRIQRNRDPERIAAKAAAHTERMRKLMSGEATGFTIKEFCEAMDWSASRYFAMPAAHKPQSILCGRTVTIVETPQEYMARRTAEQVGGVK